MTEDSAVPDLYRLAFMPGCFRCPKCNFVLTKTFLNAATGEIGTRTEDRESEPCPNDGTMMVHVTYREQLDVYAERLKEEFERIEKLRNAFRSLREYEACEGRPDGNKVLVGLARGSVWGPVSDPEYEPYELAEAVAAWLHEKCEEALKI